MTDAATEKFAALLRELKQRSGRSYGSLAARLHVSTSTLHRYCNGDAVPASYAPAERLARLCGATPEELVELHRRWHRANGTRRGATPPRATGESRAAGERDRGPGGRGTTPSWAGDGPGGDGPGGRSDRPGAGGPARPGGRTGADGLARPGDPAAGSDDAAEAADSRVPAGTSTSTATATTATATTSATRTRVWARGPRRRVVVPAVAAAAATLVALVATSSGSTGEGKGRAAGAADPGSAALTGERQGGSPEGGRTSEKGGSAEPSERRKPSPAGGTGTGRDAGPGAAPRKGGATEADPPAAAARTPLAWSVRSHVWESGCDHRYLLDKSPDGVPPPPMAQDAEAWATSQGAVHGGRTNVEAAIEPRGDRQVTITAVHVRKAATGTPLPWNAFAMSEGCGGEVTEASYSVDLDVPRPVLTPRNGADSTETWEPPALPYRVTPDDPLSLLVHATTEDHDVRWYLEVEWSSGDDSGVVRIDDRGTPFRTSALKDRPVYGYDTLNGAWYRYGRTEDPATDAATDPASDPASPTP
ncbi:helix-turn-helix domain-containing protein [Streptomyces sp. MAR4 CNX-425]|uniref:helix-turn-helix domain-containing protein n=1 Tax=Streptomyces sp. MAR4 CNX-425 TaxID=3406343 RepID=UPI003B50D033